MKIFVKEQLSPHRYKTPEGYLICTDAILARTGKQMYKKRDFFPDAADADADYEVDRLADDVFEEKAIASFENKPVTVEHPDEDVNSHNYRQYEVGFVRDVHKGEINGQPVLLGNLVIRDEQTIKEIENGEHTDLSCGYDCDVLDEDNPHQTNIRGNHVALCKEGRAGIARIQDSTTHDEDIQSYANKALSKISSKAMTDVKTMLDIYKNARHVFRNMYVKGWDVTDETGQTIIYYIKNSYGPLFIIRITSSSAEITVKQPQYTEKQYIDKAIDDYSYLHNHIRALISDFIDSEQWYLENAKKRNNLEDVKKYQAHLNTLKKYARDSVTHDEDENESYECVYDCNDMAVSPSEVDAQNYVVGKGGVWFAKAKNESSFLNKAFCSADNGDTWHTCGLERKSENPGDPSKRTQVGKYMFYTSSTLPTSKIRMGRNVLTWYANAGIHRIDESKQIDHINGDYTDDRLSNLERVSAAENIRRMQAMKKHDTHDVEPKEGEDKQSFISRFMGATKGEYPDKKQRLAVAYSYWDKHHDSCKDSYYSEQQKSDKAFVKSALEEMSRYERNWDFMSPKDRANVGCTKAELKKRIEELRAAKDSCKDVKDEVSEGMINPGAKFITKSGVEWRIMNVDNYGIVRYEYDTSGAPSRNAEHISAVKRKLNMLGAQIKDSLTNDAYINTTSKYKEDAQQQGFRIEEYGDKIRVWGPRFKLEQWVKSYDADEAINYSQVKDSKVKDADTKGNLLRALNSLKGGWHLTKEGQTTSGRKHFEFETSEKIDNPRQYMELIDKLVDRFDEAYHCYSTYNGVQKSDGKMHVAIDVDDRHAHDSKPVKDTAATLTTMCFIIDNENILIQDRVGPAWPGLAVPGGHVKHDEDIADSCMREVNEETGLDVEDLVLIGTYSYTCPEDGECVAMCYKTSTFGGELRDSKEGKVFWMKISDMLKSDKCADGFKELFKKLFPGYHEVFTAHDALKMAKIAKIVNRIKK